ncbi:PP2C family protein-serine/threonine phosphatase [Proteiniphilum sp.]|uniref:PP2C family protein-serine/threonine phosphatase n=1 Tax=Proteiniphilum sp. TaxID=1926877 RepID=UPI002B1FA1EA|nr:protein phosphatase 2C domain-containing protein [Proteiniphilum sp.]MEA4919169.1 protein phosphatase 2C domain-containing protein [Proteiniphilum sp.]MEA4949055.1 protein phosphatase 2C domain-containing protein [Petrimonas sp.]
MLLKSEINSDIGCVRANNEDMILFAGEYFRDNSAKQIVELSDSVRFAAVVADGMGGHKGGEIASEIALRLFDDFILDLADGLDESGINLSLKEWTEKTHNIILHRSYELPEQEGMGTTFCGLLFYGEMVFALNIGDSRLYRFRGGILKQLTTDHSIRQLTGDLSQGSNQIYNSLGAGESAFIDIKNISGQLLDDDLYLICSDGLSDMVADEEIEQILTENPSTRTLIAAAKNAGGKDNVSVILLKIIG